jgi:hypothetical protein
MLHDIREEVPVKPEYVSLGLPQPVRICPSAPHQRMRAVIVA